MANLPPIPIPRREQWQDIRLRVLPLIVFGATTLAITLLWRQAVMPPNFTGEVEHIESRVASAEAGTLTQLYVSRFQVVSKGTPLAVVEPVEARVLGYEVALQRLRLPWLQQKVDLATAESNLQFAEVEFNRAQGLLKKKVISPQEYDIFLKKKRALELEVAEKKRLVADLERQIERLQPSTSAIAGTASATTLLGDQEVKSPPPDGGIGQKILTAPIEGMVSMIYRRPGESVMGGEPILIIAAPYSTHIIGYMREPVSLQPEVGMDVRIRSRDANRTLAYGQVTRVGVAFEPIAIALQNPLVNLNRPETGLPVEVSLPANLQLRPGGIVDLTLLRKSRKTAASKRL
jgi:multidrug resistance efflux pump